MPRISNQDKIDQYFANPARTKKEGFEIFSEIISCDNNNSCEYYSSEYEEHGLDIHNPIGLASFAIKKIKYYIYRESVARITGVTFSNLREDYNGAAPKNFIRTQSSIGSDFSWAEFKTKEYSEEQKNNAANKIQSFYRKNMPNRPPLKGKPKIKLGSKDLEFYDWHPSSELETKIERMRKSMEEKSPHATAKDDMGFTSPPRNVRQSQKGQDKRKNDLG